jgi:hypothetical protein
MLGVFFPSPSIILIVLDSICEETDSGGSGGEIDPLTAHYLRDEMNCKEFFSAKFK